MLELFLAYRINNQIYQSEFDPTYWLGKNRKFFEEYNGRPPAEYVQMLNQHSGSTSTVTYSMLKSPQAVALKNKISSFIALDTNWNGNGARPISSQIAGRAIQLLTKCEEIASSISVFPTGRNSIQFERTNSRDEYYEIEIFLDKITVYKDGINEIEQVVDDIDSAAFFFQEKHV